MPQNNFFFRPNSSGSSSSASGATGKNYLSTYKNNPGNGDFELNVTTGWSLGNSTLDSTTKFPNGTPTFGSGASGNLSIATTSSSPLGGSYSLNYVSSAATTAGNFLASDAFTIDNEDQAKVLTFKIYYSATSNPSNANWSGTSSNSFGVAIYDVTTGGSTGWIMPAGVWGMTQSSGAGYVTGTFQTTSSSTQYRIVLFNANATSGAITLKVDDFYVGPQTAPYGPVVTDWIAYTPTGAWSTNTTYTGFWRRVGDSMQVQVAIVTSGAPTSASLTVNLPSGYTIDTAKLSSTAQNDTLGVAEVRDDSAVSVFGGAVRYNSTTSVAVFSVTSSATTLWTAVTQAAPMTFANLDAVKLEFTVPISGWSSNVQMSNDTDTRVVAATYQHAGALSVANTGTTKVTWDTLKFDTHSAMSSGTYTVPVSGKYRVSAHVLFASSLYASGNRVIVSLSKNGSTYATGSRTYISGAITDLFGSELSTTVDCNAGDTLEIYAANSRTAGSTNLDGTATDNYVSIERISGPSVVAANETVAARYYASSTTPGTTGATAKITYSTKDFDTHNAYSGGTYTAPVSGTYYVTASLYMTAATTAAGNAVTIGIRKNGSSNTVGTNFFISSSAKPITTSTSDLMKLNTGDTVEVYGGNDGTTPSIQSSNTVNFFSIVRVGN